MWEKHKDLIEMVQELAGQVRSAVRPMLGSSTAKDIGGQGVSGDTTFGIDVVAELKVKEFLGQRGDMAYYTEDQGLQVIGRPEHVLIIDPIDGTRPAAAGMEACCVSVAVARYPEGKTEELTLGDVFLGLVVEIKNSASYMAVRGHGVHMESEGKTINPALSDKIELDRIFWTIGFRGRPAAPLVEVLGELIDLSSVDGGCFDLGSATFCINRVLTGEMDLYLDVGQRMAQDVEAVREMFLEVGHGSILNNYPYDLAAAALIASESGAVVTDAYGGSLETYRLIPASGEGQISSIISGNRILHELVLEKVDRGMARLAEKHGQSPGR